MRLRLLPWILVVLLAWPGSRAWPREAIIWHYFSFPPLYTLPPDGGHPRGAAVTIQNRLIAVLDEFDHVRRQFTIPRAFALARADVLLCFVGPHRTPEREEFLVYSRPFFVYAPPMLTVRVDTATDEAGGRPQSLIHLLREQGARFGLPAQISYGPEIDAIIEAHGGSVLRLYGEGRNERALLLLSVGRIDYTIVQPFEFTWIATRDGLRDTLTQVPLVEATQFDGFAIACTDTAAGRRAIAAIDRHLSNPDIAETFQQIMLQWVEPRLRPLFGQALTRVQSTPPWSGPLESHPVGGAR